jgi:hypothetical protein
MELGEVGGGAAHIGQHVDLVRATIDLLDRSLDALAIEEACVLLEPLDAPGRLAIPAPAFREPLVSG